MIAGIVLVIGLLIFDIMVYRACVRIDAERKQYLDDETDEES